MNTPANKHNGQVRLSERFLAARRGALRAVLCGVAMCLSSVPAFSLSITDAQFSSLQGGKFEVRLSFDGAPPQPKGYTIEKPARIALDFADTASALKQKKFPLAYGNASSAVIIESGGRSRLVLNLVELTPYTTRIEGNDLVVEVGAGGGEYLTAGVEAPVVPSAKPKAQVLGNRITDLDFKRGDEGEGRLVVMLQDPKADINVYEEGSRIFVRFDEVQLPDNLQRRYDVGDFATPVQVVDASVDERGAVFALKSSGDYDYLAYQADNEYVLSVKPLTPEEVEERRGEFAYVGEKLSLNFQDIEVRAVLQLIADFTELNLVASDTVKGNITLRLKNVPWDQALELVLKTKGLDKRQVGNVLMVAPAAEIAERERQEIEAQKQVQELAPLRTEFIRIRYAEAKELFKLFKPEGGADGATHSILSPRGKVIVDERTNSLLVTETADKLEEFRRLVKLIDVPVRQVQIEARIVRASDDFDQSLGIRWGGAYIGDKVIANDTFDNVIETANAVTSGGDIPVGAVTDLGVGGAAGSLAVGYITSKVFLNMELAALESRGRGEVVSQPKVITGDKEPAIIKEGTELPFTESAANGETTITFKEAVLKLEVTPHITPDDRIILDLLINQDTVGELVIATGLGGQFPAIDTTELKTKVLVGNGQTVVLGGVYNTQELETVTKVPFLGDIPYLGRFFRNKTVTQEKLETLIFITPRILAETLVQ